MALDLHEAGVGVMRQKLRRDNPGLDEAAVERLLHAWLCERPGARHGDAEGAPVEWPRRTP